MRVLFVVHRYGLEVAGGAELACRLFATRLVERGHRVEVITSRAVSYVDWANEYPPGTADIDGVVVHRLDVRRNRETRFFGPLSGRVLGGHRPSALIVQEAWMQAQGPDTRELVPWLRRHADAFDLVVFVGYLYSTSWTGLPEVAHRIPTLLNPAAHDEPPLWLPLFDLLFRLPTAYAYFTEEEQALIERRCRHGRPGTVVGIGMDLDPAAEADRFRRRFGLGGRPYLLYAGRVDPSKGSAELLEQFQAYKSRHDDDLALVVMGDLVSPLEAQPDVVVTGFVDDQTKTDAIAGCLALVQPSYFESFSMVLTEAWAQSRPALVQGACDVLAGQARRSHGAVAYHTFAEFEVAVELLIEQPALGEALGRSGHSYVRDRYAWPTVITRYEELLTETVDSFLVVSPTRPGFPAHLQSGTDH
jgi:glycosyltransferase involved in cell wall biosynthesis